MSFQRLVPWAASPWVMAPRHTARAITSVLVTIILMTTVRNAGAVDWHDASAVAAAAVSQNPTLSRLHAEIAAARERTAQAGSLPNPMVMTGVQDKQIDLTNDEMMTMVMVGASQTFVRPSKRDARRKMATLEVEGLEQLLVSIRAEIERDALVAYDDIRSMDSQIRTAGEMRELIGAVIDAARVRYEVGIAAQSDVIRAQLERSNLDHQILRLQGARNVAAARLLPMLGLAGGTEIPPLALPQSSEMSSIDLSAVLTDEHPAIALLQIENRRQEELIRLTRLQTRPDITVEGSFGYRPDQTDMVSVIARIELPIRRNTLIEPRIREALATQDATRLRRDETQRALNMALGIAAASFSEATEQLKLHEEVLVPQARLAFESTLASYQSGTSSFDAILATENILLRLRLQELEFRTQRLKAVTQIEALQRGARGGTGSGIAGGFSAAGFAASSNASASMSGM